MVPQSSGIRRRRLRQSSGSRAESKKADVTTVTKNSSTSGTDCTTSVAIPTPWDSAQDTTRSPMVSIWSSIRW